MPWSPAQIRLFQAAAHSRLRRKGLSPAKARELLAEGRRRKVASALAGRKRG
ncbi:MAG: hypothetical protein [Siphoviridae sp. ctdEk19]|nr:MAG: hypothetical protein [Siphoviridae sp. ctdEk19]